MLILGNYECRVQNLNTTKVVMCAANVFEGLGATNKVEDCKVILQDIEKGQKNLVTSGKLLETRLCLTYVDFPFLVHGTE